MTTNNHAPLAEAAVLGPNLPEIPAPGGRQVLRPSGAFSKRAVDPTVPPWRAPPRARLPAPDSRNTSPTARSRCSPSGMPGAPPTSAARQRPFRHATAHADPAPPGPLPPLASLAAAHGRSGDRRADRPRISSASIYEACRSPREPPQPNAQESRSIDQKLPVLRPPLHVAQEMGHVKGRRSSTAPSDAAGLVGRALRLRLTQTRAPRVGRFGNN